MEEIQLLHTPKDFKSDQEVRWCPGCGDHAILSSVTRALSALNIPREKLDKIVESNTTLIDTEIKPTLKVANL